MKAYREAEGWKFYYSPEGYPYYFNDVTGVSEWATQDTYYSSLEDEHTAQQHAYYGEAESTGTSSSPTKAKTGTKSRAYERSGDDDEEVGSRNDEENDEDEDDDDEGDGEEEDEESGSSSLDEGLEKRFRQYLRTPEGIAAVLEEQDRIIKYMEHTEKKKQRKQETQYLKSLFLNKKYDGEAKSASKRKTGEAAASVLSTTVAAAWSWITEKPPSEETKEAKDSKRGSGAKSGSSSSSGGSGKGTATQRVKSSGQESSGDSAEKDVEQPADDDDSDGGESDDGDDGDEDASSLSSEDSDVEVIKAPLFSELPAWMSWRTVEERVLQPSSQFLSQAVASIAATTTTTSTNGDGSTGGNATTGTDALWQNVSQHAWQISVTAATFTGQLTYLVITRTYAVMEPYLITFMEQIIDIDQNNTQSQNNPLAQAHQRRIEDLSTTSPRPSYPPSSSSSSAAQAAAAMMISPRFPVAPPSTPRPEMVTPRGGGGGGGGGGGMEQLPAVPPRAAPWPRAVAPPSLPRELAIPTEVATAAADACVTPPALDALELSIGHETPNASGWKEIASDEDHTPVTTSTIATVAAVSDSPAPMEATAVTEAPSDAIPSSESTETPIEDTTRVIV